MKTIIAGMLCLFAAQVWGQCSPIVVDLNHNGVHLGPEGRGSVALLTAMAWLSASLATLGIQEANSNLAASEPATRSACAPKTARVHRDSMASFSCVDVPW